jgi:hypothetical protein
MTPRAKLALGGVVVVGTLAALFAGSKTASAATPTPTPTPTPSPGNTPNPWPSDGMPWNIYSATTLNRQRAYNAAVIAANTSLESDPPLFGRPYLTEDGILGPDTCTQLSYWQSWGGPNVPIACRVSNI